MAGIDKAAIAFTVAIVAIGVGMAMYGENIQNTQTVSTPITNPEPPMESEPPVEEPMESEIEDPMMDSPQTVIVDIPVGTSVPGCEATDECYIPTSITINAGDTVQWDNIDTVAHTVTSGTTRTGPTGEFDSSLILANSSYDFTFEESGSYDYFCLVHPWMLGDVQVN